MIKSRRLRRRQYVVRTEEIRSVFKVLKSKPTGKRPLGRPMLRWEENIRMHLKEIGITTRDCIDSVQDRQTL